MNFLVNCVNGIAIGAGAILPGIVVAYFVLFLEYMKNF